MGKTGIPQYIILISPGNHLSGPISEQFRKEIHSVLMKDIQKSDGTNVNSGSYRTEASKLNNIWFTPSPPDMIGIKMKYLIEDFYSGVEKSIHPVELASVFHQRFEEVHPFDDGNGRTGREILNHMLRRSGFPQIYIPPLEHQIYFYCLTEGNKPNYVPLIDFVIHRMYQTMMYLMTKGDMGVETFSEDYMRFYEATAGKEGFKKFIKLTEDFDSKEFGTGSLTKED
ncbi:MAG: Fic family protein [Thermoproteota archaeon]|nr:Fic family protein [Thermoproteota archaeon]